eukprot:scpid91604/ scgid19411/ Cyclin-dependent kinase B2-1
MDNDTLKVVGCDSGTEYEVLLDKQLGFGCMASVVQGRVTSSGANVAIKIANENKDLKNEIHVLRVISGLADCPYVIRFLDECITSPESRGRYMAIELGDCDLIKFMRNICTDRARQHPIEVKYELTRQMFSGLAFLHAGEICHADLLPFNIMLNISQAQIKICDFGNSVACENIPHNRLMLSRMTFRDLHMTATSIIFPLWSGSRFLIPSSQQAIEVFSEMPGFELVIEEACSHFFEKSLDRVNPDKAWFGKLSVPVQIAIMAVFSLCMYKVEEIGGHEMSDTLIPVMGRCLGIIGNPDLISAVSINEQVEIIVTEDIRQSAANYIKSWIIPPRFH